MKEASVIINPPNFGDVKADWNGTQCRCSFFAIVVDRDRSEQLRLSSTLRQQFSRSRYLSVYNSKTMC
jgi:hypothetical protein